MVRESFEEGTAVKAKAMFQYFQPQKSEKNSDVASLVFVLNLLQKDVPAESGEREWFLDEMVADPATMARIEHRGLSFDDFVLLCKRHASVCAFKASDTSLADFTNELVKMSSCGESHVIASYSRAVLKQTMALISDAATHVCPFHWLRRKFLWESMNEVDASTGQTNGFMVLRSKSGDTLEP